MTGLSWPTGKYIRELLRYRTGFYIVNFFIWGLIHSLPVLFGLCIKGIFDALSGSAAAGLNAWTFLILLLLANLWRLGMWVIGEQTWARYWLGFSLLIRRNLLDYLMTASGSRRLPESPSEAVTRFREDVWDVADYVENWVDVGGMIVFSLVAVVAMFLIAPWMTVVICIPIFSTVLLTNALTPHIRSFRRRKRQATSRVTDFIGEMFGAVQAVKVAGKESSMIAHFEELNDVRRHAALKDSLLTQLLRSVNRNMVYIAIGIILLMSARRMVEGNFSVGDFALFIAYLPRLTDLMAFMGDMIAQFRRAEVSLERMQRLLQDAPPEAIVKQDAQHFFGDIPTLGQPQSVPDFQGLQVKALGYRYPDGETGIDNISFELKPGSFTVITGRIGAGKTTLLRVLMGLLPKDQGEVLWNGTSVTDAASFFVPPRTAYTSQVPRLFSDKLRENVQMGYDDRGLDRAIKLAVLDRDIDHLEHGLDTLVGTRGVKLSGGQVQRSSAARMFMRQAQVMIFDDLSSALDVETEQRLWEQLLTDADVTCLVVSHRRVALQRADHIIVLKEGQIEAQGQLGELLEYSAEMQHLWHKQGA